MRSCRYGLLMLLLALPLRAQQSTVYTTVVSTGAFVVGAANSETGLFFQRPSDDTAWHHTGWSRIRAFGVAVDPAKAGQRCFVAAGNGVHMTADGGASWRVTTGWRSAEVLWVTMDPSNADILYAATPYGVFASRDGAASWAEKNTGLPKLPFTSSVIVDRSDHATVYCSTEDGAYKSTDAGETWARMSLSVGGIRVIAQNPHDSAMLVAGTEDNGIYISRDGGKVWAKSESGVDHSTFYTVAFDPRDPGVMYAGGYVTGVYRSSDGGASWRRVNQGLTNLTIHSIAVDPTDPQRIYAASMGGGIFRSDDAGGHWRCAGLSGSEVWSVIIMPF
jgi:photosystem II stability/assembly factor-like uncharacterized protein